MIGSFKAPKIDPKHFHYHGDGSGRLFFKLYFNIFEEIIMSFITTVAYFPRK